MKLYKHILSTLLAIATVTFAATAQDTEYHEYFGPEDIEDLAATFDVATTSVRVTFTTPTQGSYWADGEDHYLPLPYLDEVILTRTGVIDGEYENVEVMKWTNAEAGKKYEFIDTEIVEGVKYTYDVRPWFNDNYGYSNSAAVNTFIKPAMIADFTISAADENGNLPVQLSATVPATDENKNPLPEGLITALVFVRGDTDSWGAPSDVVARVDNPTMGQKYTQEDATAELNKEYTYGVYVETAVGKSEMTTKNFRTGQDIPAAVNVKTMKVESSATAIVLSWDAVTTGASGGVVDPATVKYNIYEYDFESTSWDPVFLLEEGVTGTTYTVELTDLTQPVEKLYSISAVTPAGESEIVEFPKVIAGPPAELPFFETFNKKKDDWGGIKQFYSWIISSLDGVTYPDIYCTTYGYFYKDPWGYGGEVNFTGVDGDLTGEEEIREGMIGSYFESQSINLLTSCQISMEGTQWPVLSLSLYKTPAELESTSVVKVEVKADDGEFVEVAVLNCSNDDDEYGWATEYVPLNEFKDADAITLRFRTVSGEVPSPIFMDNIAVTDYPTVANLTAVVSDDKASVELTWDAPTTETLTVEGYDVYADGVKVNEELLTDTHFTYTLPKDKESVTMRVDAVYEYVTTSVETVVDGYTGITEISSQKVNITTKEGVISISNPVGAKIRIYNAIGIIVYEGTAMSANVATGAGFFVVDVAGVGYKIIVH